ncbi:peptidoglycan/xylan/chitin deacetylase (PgdA/CDA1 family) [Paenibacillus forsythiae]|uniref:Peptidoglycan/xylan/chitin deacetylase (PgdA/CDA1 family) n=1 Tax=Paenibacillus forsythiae TaxID=365616 RepID=A0ABU3H7Y1_9BACL|nr:polysaccharide deacetylase family protein [Paenibacillus forsythiae]MDT3426846.1 peptidoglycan/xylan/chitin deacetylase (PgdA/CDA1 family) [Paenibacillus forsythiae]
MGKQTAAALLLAAFLLTSCSSAENGAQGGEAAPAAHSAKASSPAAVTAAPTAGPSALASAPAVGSGNASARPAASASPAGGSADSGERDGSGTDVKVPFLYHMNKNYDIKPNEESTNKRIVLLTFDDGPKEAKLINSIFDTLDRHRAKAIFFVNGYRIKEHPELLKLIQERGGIIGNHSWDHIVLKDKPYTAVKKQIEDVQRIVKEITGDTPVFFRPPHGAGGDVGKRIAAENGMLYMTWSNGSLDWTMNEEDAGKTEKLIQNVTGQLHSGSNILMHELPWTTEALDKLLTTLESKGYGFVDPRSIEPKMR